MEEGPHKPYFSALADLFLPAALRRLPETGERSPLPGLFRGVPGSDAPYAPGAARRRRSRRSCARVAKGWISDSWVPGRP